MNCSSLTAFGSAGFTVWPSSSRYGTFLTARWNGSWCRPASRSMNEAVKNVNSDAAGPELESALGHAAAGQLEREVGVLDDLRTAVDRDDDAQLLVRREAFDDLERDLRAGFEVQAEERRIGDRVPEGCRLENRRGFSRRARAFHPDSLARGLRAGRPARRCVPPCPSGARAMWSLAARSILPVVRSNAGIWPWVKNRSLSRPKRSCCSKNAMVVSWFSGLVMT